MGNTKIYGLRAIAEAIESGKTIEKVFLQNGLKGELYSQLESLIRSNGISMVYVPIEKLNRLSHNNHQGAVANISPVEFYELETLINTVTELKKNALFLVLDRLSDVRNFGAIIRTAECAGVDGIIIPKSGSAPLNGDAIKTSAGAVFKVPISKVNHIKDALFMLKAYDIKVIAATEKANQNIYDMSFKGPCAIIMGAEDKGITPSVLKLTDEKAKLPMAGGIASLNVSVACGAILYEVVRQRL